jgi:hypothetical protein
VHQLNLRRMVGNLLAYRDDNHPTTPYSSWLSPLLGHQLDQAIRTHRCDWQGFRRTQTLACADGASAL